MKKLISFFMALAIIFTSAVVEFPLTAVTAQAAAAFTPRTTAPSATDKYWLHTSAGGLNECIVISGNSVLPNCVGYAWGRAYEILRTKPKLSKGNAGGWYQYNISNKCYSYGSTPKLGAIGCWTKDGNVGHVAVVENFSSNNSVTFSESNYGGERFRYFTTNPSTYCNSMGYTFQGYIYLGECNGVQSKIDKLKTAYPNGSYFSVSGGACTAATHKSEGWCSNCLLNSIPARNGAPAGSAAGLGEHYSCASFANYAFYYIFGHNRTEKTTSSVTSLSKGDLVHMFWTQAAGNGGQHWFIYLGEDATNYYVYDANYKFTQQIRYNAAIPKSSVDWFSDVYHATDYDDINGGHAHNYKYKYFLEAHPHRDYYECSCGDGYVDNSSSRYYISKGCSECGATITPNTYYFVNKGTGKALNLEYNIDANQTNVHMYDLSIGYPSQQMVVSVRSSSDKSYKIRPTSSKRLVQPFGDSGVTTSGMNVNIYDDVNDNTQWWHFQPVSGGYVIRNAANTSCVLTASGENAIVSTYTGSNNQIWTLQPVAQKYTISYNANGGSGTMANTEMTVGTAANLRANAFTRTGYTFLGWSTSSSATSATYIDKQSVKDLAKSGTVTLYAVWAIKDLTGVSNVKMTATETTVKLSWDKDSTATYYEIQKRVYGESGCEKVIRLNSDITSYTVTGLKPGTSYVFEIGSYNDASGVIYTCNTITTNPSAITGFKGTAKSTVVTLSWDKNAGATEYKLQQQTNGAWLTIASPTETSYTVTGLKANTTYNFRIFARNGNAQSTQTKLTVTTTDAIAPVSGFTGNAAADSIMLEWHHIGVATSFKLQQSINGAWQTIAETNKTSFNVTGLKANTTYNFRIFARYYDLQSAQTKLTVTTPAAVPTAVTGFKGTAAADSITLKWNKVANATSYKLQQQINGAWQTIASPTGTTYIISGLKANTSYNFRIFARNSAGQGAQTKLTITTLAAVPPAVTGFTGAAAADSITLKWNKAANATSYKLQQQINGAWQTIASPTGTTYIVSGLKANTSYNFRIFTRNSAGQGAQTKLTVTTSAGTPTTVTGFTGAAAADSITLKWNKAANATSYKLQQQINGAWQTIASPTGTTYIVSGLKAKTSYNFRIFPRNSAGQGAQTKLSVKTLAGTPAAVTGFSGTATEKSITLKWNKVSGATEYKLQQSINGAWQTIASPTGTSYTVKGLKSNTSYNFRIFARNSSGQGTQTKLTVKTTAGKPAAVTGFTGTATKNSITLKWNKVSGATEYKLQQMTDSGWETIAMPTGNTLTVSGLNAKTMYNFRIFARSGSLQSDQVKLTVRTTN